jgi:hypothetical protein
MAQAVANTDTSSSSSTLNGLGESTVPTSSIVVSLRLLLGLSMSRFPDG